MADRRIVCDSSRENLTTNGRRPLASKDPCGFQLPSYVPMLATILVDSNCPLVNLDRRMSAVPAHSLRDCVTGSDLCRFHYLLRVAVILKWRLLYDFPSRKPHLLTRE
jgi:hypothetical protein